MTIIENDRRISPRLTRIVLEGMQEIIGADGLLIAAGRISNSILNQGKITGQPPEGLRFIDVNSLQQAFVERYGNLGARGAALRSGRSTFCYFLKEFNEEAGFNQLDFRLTPMRKRVLLGLVSVARILSREIGQPIQVQIVEKAWTWQIDNCPECWGRQSETAACYFTIGLLQEFLSWLSGGKVYMVEETACAAQGDPYCLIRINQKPLD